jgi:hypothetical protein
MKQNNIGRAIHWKWRNEGRCLLLVKTFLKFLVWESCDDTDCDMIDVLCVLLSVGT